MKRALGNNYKHFTQFMLHDKFHPIRASLLVSLLLLVGQIEALPTKNLVRPINFSCLYSPTPKHILHVKYIKPTVALGLLHCSPPAWSDPTPDFCTF